MQPTLIADVEARVLARGVETAWQTYAVGNHRHVG